MELCKSPWKIILTILGASIPFNLRSVPQEGSTPHRGSFAAIMKKYTLSGIFFRFFA